MKFIVYIATSIDGFIAGENDNLDFLNSVPNPEKSDFGFGEFMNSVDAVLMGRKTYKIVEAFSEWFYSKRVFVLSNSLKSLPENFNSLAEIITGDIDEIIAKFQKLGIESVYVDGGLTIRSFLKRDLIDEMTITRVPVVLGKGVPLFDEMDIVLQFEHVRTEVINNYLVKTTYRRKSLI